MQCAGCQIQIEPGTDDTSKCVVSHNCLRTRAVLTLCQNPTQHSNVFSWRTYAFLDNTSLFYSCSFIDAVFADLSDAWGVGQHLEHHSSGLSESDVLFLWLLCAGGKCFDHLQAHQTLDQPAYASMRA